MKISKRVHSILATSLLITTVVGAQVTSTKDVAAKENTKSALSTVCPKRQSRKGGGRYSISEGRRIKAERAKRRREGVKPNRFYTKPFKGQKVHTTARALVEEAFKRVGIDKTCIPKKGYNEHGAARNDFAQEISKLERVVKNVNSQLRRMKISPNAQGRKELEKEFLHYYDTKILPRMKRLRAAEIAADFIHKEWSYSWNTGNYSRLYDRYNSAQQVSEVYFEYLRERLRVTTELRLRVKGSNTIPYNVLYAYKGSIKRVHILHQRYRTGEFVLAVAKYEFHKDAYGANTLMDISKRLLKPSFLPNVNYRDNDQVPQPLASMSVNLIFGGKENRKSADLERQMKKELEVDFRKNVSQVIAKIAEDGMAALQKQGYHLSNNGYFVLSAVFEFLIFDVGLLDDVTKARLASKADDIKKFQGTKKGASVADDVPTPRSRTSSATDDLDNARSTKKRRTQDDAPDNRRRSQQDEIEAKKKKQQQEEANNRRRNSSCGKSVAYVPTGGSFGFGLAMINPSPLLAFLNPSSNLIAASKSNCYTTGKGDVIDEVQHKKLLQDGGEIKIFQDKTFRNDDVISGNLNKTISETNKTLKNVGIDLDLRELSFKRRGGKRVKVVDSNGSTTKYISPVDKPGGLSREKVLNIRSKKAKYIAKLDDRVFIEAFDKKKVYVQYLDASDLPVNRRTSKVRIADEFSTNSQQVYLYDNPSPEFYNVNYKIYETKVSDSGILQRTGDSIVEIGSHPDGHFNTKGIAGAVGDPMPGDANALVPHLNVKISDPVRAKAAARNVIMKDFDGKVPKGTQSSLDKVREVESHFVYGNSYPRQKNGGKIPTKYVTERAKTIKQYYNAARVADGNFSKGSTFLDKVKKIRFRIPGRIRRAIKNFSIKNPLSK